MIELIQGKAAEVADLMKERLNIHGKDLAAKLRHTGRMMPKRIKREAAYLVEACALVENPKLQKMIDMDRVGQAHQSCVEFLKTVDAADRRKGILLGVFASIALSLLVVLVLVSTVLVWRGYL